MDDLEALKSAEYKKILEVQNSMSELEKLLFFFSSMQNHTQLDKLKFLTKR
jgi:hypothetical protein